MEIPSILQSDQGTNFESDLLHQVLRSSGVKKTRTTPFHPRSDALVERANRSLLQMFRTHVRNESQWSGKNTFRCSYTPTALLGTSQPVTPFTLMFGRDPKGLPIVPMVQNPWNYSINNWSVSLQQTMRRLQALAQEHLASASEQQKHTYERLHDQNSPLEHQYGGGTPGAINYDRSGKEDGP
ncbi:hypothetical protein D918_10159 [Trichuris suis]|nr:hypothetical protein D918_10159 [Trichuris suis]